MSSKDDRKGPGPSVRRRGWVGVSVGLFVVVAMTGCGGGGAGPSGSDSGSSASQPSLVPSTQQPSLADGVETYVGMLGSDAIEGGCAYLQSADGGKYEVIYPDGWTLRKSPLELVAPDGHVVAEAGDEVTIRGTRADMASICQIGPIIQATEVVTGS
jgi:hypothetical protein